MSPPFNSVLFHFSCGYLGNLSLSRLSLSPSFVCEINEEFPEPGNGRSAEMGKFRDFLRLFRMERKIFIFTLNGLCFLWIFPSSFSSLRFSISKLFPYSLSPAMNEIRLSTPRELPINVLDLTRGPTWLCRRTCLTEFISLSRITIRAKSGS